MDEHEANLKAYKKYIKNMIYLDLGITLAIIIAIWTTGRLYPLWLLLLLGTKSFYDFTHEEVS